MQHLGRTAPDGKADSGVVGKALEWKESLCHQSSMLSLSTTEPPNCTGRGYARFLSSGGGPASNPKQPISGQKGASGYTFGSQRLAAQNRSATLPTLPTLSRTTRVRPPPLSSKAGTYATTTFRFRIPAGAMALIILPPTMDTRKTEELSPRAQLLRREN